MNETEIILKQELPKIINKKDIKNFWLKFKLLTIKRFFLLTFFIFIYQYITSIHLKNLWPAYPMYPPIGLSFVMFYLFGFDAFFGLFLSGLFVYFINDHSFYTLSLFLIADLLGGYLGALISQNIFSSDIYIFTNGKQINQFIIKNFLITSLFSSVLRTLAIIFEQYKITNAWPSFSIIFYFIDFWISDLNAILIIAGFILSWVYISFSRIKIIPKELPFFNLNFKFNFIFSFLIIILILIPIFYLNQFWDIYIIILNMILSSFIANFYNSFIITANLFIFATIYLAYFIIYKQYYLLNMGHPAYTSILLFLLIFTIGCFYLANNHDKLTSKIAK